MWKHRRNVAWNPAAFWNDYGPVSFNRGQDNRHQAFHFRPGTFVSSAGSQTAGSTVSVHTSLELEWKFLKETRNSSELKTHRNCVAN